MDLSDDEYNDLMESLAEQRGRTYVRTTRVKTADLLQTVNQNKKEHVEDYKKALEVYRTKRLKAIRKLARKAEKNPEISLSQIQVLPLPQSFEKEYDTAIAQIEFETREEIELNEEEFKNLVLDQWGWSDRFAGSTQVYNHR